MGPLTIFSVLNTFINSGVKKILDQFAWDPLLRKFRGGQLNVSPVRLACTILIIALSTNLASCTMVLEISKATSKLLKATWRIYGKLMQSFQSRDKI